MGKEQPKIFLSYAHEDIAMAKRLYQDLKRYGLDVWIDCENLLPGQNWKVTIEKNIKQSKYYLLLLSSHSMTKRDFIQKEMKIAYEVLENCSDEDIYLIPVRINECEPSFKISDIHYIDVFPETEYQNGLKKILQVVSPGTFIIRNKQEELSSSDVTVMLRKHGYYDRDRNPEGTGFFHKYYFKEISDDKVVLDEATGIMWQQGGSSENMEYTEARKWAEELNRKGYAGYKDWRLPTLEEGMSLMEPSKNKDGLYINSLFDKKENCIWTSDLIKSESGAWVVGFYGGYCFDVGFYNKFYVRAVRSGQSSSE